MRQNLRIQLFAIGATITLLIFLTRSTPMVATPEAAQTGQIDQVAISSAKQIYQKLPLGFEAHKNPQSDQPRFIARGHGYNVTITANEIALKLAQQAKATIGTPPIRMKLVNANNAPRVEADEALPGQINYLIGNDPRNWRKGLTAYARLKQEAVYPGVDFICYGNQQQLEYDFVVAPGADPHRINLTFDGVEKIELDSRGDLLLNTALGQVRQHRPAIYQQVNGERKTIEGGYKLRNRTISFQIGEYNSSLPLVIDPILVYSTFLGSSSNTDLGTDIAVDASGNAYVTGFTDASDFPTEKAFQKTFKSSGDCGDGLCPDVFVVKLNPAGDGFVYATYLGGDGADTGGSIAVDATGNAYITGTTSSANFPTVKPYQASLKNLDAFIAKLSADGSTLIYSTYFGGAFFESGTGIAVDQTGSAYVTGTTIGSTDLPLANAFQNASGGGNCDIGDAIPCPDAFVAKFNPAGNGLAYSTFLGGNRFDMSTGIAVDSLGQAVITGSTGSANFPTRNAAQANFAGGTCELADLCFDAFVTKLAADGRSLVFSTYLGGKREDGPIDVSNGVAVDDLGNTYIAGTTFSTDFPVKNSLRNGLGAIDSFVTKFDSVGAIIYSTYLGGNDLENILNAQFAILSFIGQSYSGNSIAVDAVGNAYIVGTTQSSDFPTLNPTQPRIGGGTCDGEPCTDAFMTKLSPTGALISSTFLGGNNLEGGLGIAVDTRGNTYITGLTASPNFPLASPKQNGLRGATDLFITKIGEAASPANVTSVSAASFLGPQLAPESIVSAFGTGLATQTINATTLPLPTALAGTTVTIRDSLGTERLAPLFFVAPIQVNYQITPGTPTGAITVTIASGNGQISRGTAQVLSIAPGLFSANASGQGVASAVVLRVRNGQQLFEPLARFDSAGNQFVPVPIDLGADAGSATDQVFLVLFGTGIRLRNTALATIGGVSSEVLFSGPSSFVGVDQCNVRIPRSLIGRGEADVIVTADGRTSNAVRVAIR